MRPILALMALVAGCATFAPPAHAADRFVNQLRALCGQAFEGRVETTDPADSDLASQRLVMHVRECGPDTLRIPFHVGEDRSRTWVLTRTATGLRLKHDHRHEDGSEDVLTQYGGDTVEPGTDGRQSFPADAFSRELFVRQNIPVSADNVWSMEIEPGRAFVYELRRPNRLLRVVFDLSRPVATPPAPWGAE